VLSSVQLHYSKTPQQIKNMLASRNVHTSQILFINCKLFMQITLLYADALQSQHVLEIPFLLEPCVLPF
jgi:hypothetical protein